MVKTDQWSLRFIREQREIGADYQKWILKLMGYDFDIVYNPGASNRVADALSRIPEACVELAHYSALMGSNGTYYNRRSQGMLIWCESGKRLKVTILFLEDLPYKVINCSIRVATCYHTLRHLVRCYYRNIMILLLGVTQGSSKHMRF